MEESEENRRIDGSIGKNPKLGLATIGVRRYGERIFRKTTVRNRSRSDPTRSDFDF